MIRSLLTLWVLSSFMLQAQITTETIESSVLGTTRTIDLYIPEIEEGSLDQLPLIVVLEGHELFDLVVANVRFLSKIDYMPKSIVVGVRQEGPYQVARDCETDKNSGQLSTRGSNFKQFIVSDVVQRLSIQYPISNLKVLIGKNMSANFMNYFLLNGPNMFSSYIAITPEVSAQIIEPLTENAAKVKKTTNYYISNSGNLPRRQKNNISLLTEELKKQKNKQFILTTDAFSFPDEFSTPAYSIPIALEGVFRVYQPISPKEYRENILKDTLPSHNYLVSKYQKISNQLGIQKRYILNDIMAIFAAAQKKSDAESLFVLGDLALEDYPSTMLGHYFNGLAYEITGNTKKALKNYERAYTLDPIDFVTKELILNKIESLK